MAKKVGLSPPPPPISVRNLVDLASRIILPLAPVDLQPQDGARDVSNNPDLFWRDPGAGTPAAAIGFSFVVSQNGVIVDPDHILTGDANIQAPLTPPGPKWFFPLPPGDVMLTVAGVNKAGVGPSSESTFTVSGPPPPPPPTPPTISVSSSGKGAGSEFTVKGSGFQHNAVVTIRVVDDQFNEKDFTQSATATGELNARFSLSCTSGLSLHFSATDNRLNQQGQPIFSNIFTIPCP
jgi:hypothetical protein